MKKTIVMLTILAGIFGFGMTQAYAIPTIDGLLTVGTEWDNVSSGVSGGYIYYLDVPDVDEVGVGQSYDLERGVVLQHLDYVNPGAIPLPTSDANTGNDGVYVLIKTYGSPSLVDVNGITTRASVALFADFNGDGVASAAGGGYPDDIQLYIINTNNVGGNPPSSDKVYVCYGAAGSCDASNGTLIWDGGVIGATPPGFLYARGTYAIEMFMPTAQFGTPDHGPFPISFAGEATYDDGTDNPDDTLRGTNAVIPEPGTMMLLGMGLLSLFGVKKFRS